MCSCGAATPGAGHPYPAKRQSQVQDEGEVGQGGAWRGVEEKNARSRQQPVGKTRHRRLSVHASSARPTACPRAPPLPDP